MSLEFLTLEAIQEFGVPVELDSVALTQRQCRVFASIVDKLMDEAEHPKDFALSKAEKVFRHMFEKVNDEWRAIQKIKLTTHGGVVVRNKFYNSEHRERMMRKVKDAMKGNKDISENIVSTLMEAGKRNSGKDKKAVTSALSALFDVLNPSDQQEILKALRKKLKGKVIKFKGAKK